MTRAARSTAAALAGLGMITPAAADVLCLKDGRIFENVALAREADSVIVSFEHGDVTIPEASVLECIIEGDREFVPVTDEERERAARGQVRFQGKWMSARRRDDLVARMLAERREAVEEMKATRLWRSRHLEETTNFAFEVTVPEHVFERYRDLCESFFREFAEAWKIRKPRGVGKLTVKFYGDEESYRQLTSASPGVIGFFTFLEPYELNVFYDRLDPLGTEEVMYHEIGHYLLKLIDVDFSYPHWPAESLCEFYSSAVFDPEKGRVTWGGVHEGRAAAIRHDMERGDWVTVEELVTDGPVRTYHDYTWGWSLVHFLLSTPEHAQNFRKFFLALARDSGIERRLVETVGVHRLMGVSGEEMMKAFRKSMKIRSDEDLARLQEEWYDHIDEQLVVSTPRGMESAAVLAQRLGLKQRARRLFQEAVEAEAPRAVTFHRYATLLEELDEDGEARDSWRRAIELDPLVPEYYISLGKSLLASGEERTSAEGERLLRLALDIEPENLYLESNLERLVREGRSSR